MTDPKFLKLDKGDIVKYAIRLDEILLDKYRELANLTDTPINQTIINALDSYITHLNTTSTVICNGKYEMVDGFLLGHEEKFYVNTPIRFIRFYSTL